MGDIKENTIEQDIAGVDIIYGNIIKYNIRIQESNEMNDDGSIVARLLDSCEWKPKFK